MRLDSPEVYVIAELGVNHDGSTERALDLVRAAERAGADAVKFQCFHADLLMSRSARLAAYQSRAGERDPVEMLRRLELPRDAMARAIDLAHELGLDAIVTVFSVELVEDARRLPWDAFKTASPDLVNRPLLEAIALDPRPLIVSTGAADADEVRRALAWLAPPRSKTDLALLQCVSAYPTPPEQASIGAMLHLARLWPGPIGYSDHTSGTRAGALAAALGARVLEKHLTHSRAAAGPDHAASLDEAGFAQYVRLARAAAPASIESLDHEVEIGPAVKRVLDIERDVRRVSRQSIVATRDLHAGHPLSRADLTLKRPGTGLLAFELPSLLGRTLARDVARDELLALDHLSTSLAGSTP